MSGTEPARPSVGENNPLEVQIRSGQEAVICGNHVKAKIIAESCARRRYAKINRYRGLSVHQE